MRETSLVKAKAHLSELVDAAEHKGQRILILRHGKPAAAIVPVEVAAADPEPPKQPRKRMTAEQFDVLIDKMIAATAPSDMTIEEALGRDRLDRY